MSREDARINRRKCLATKHRHIPSHSFIHFRVKLILPPMLVHCRKCVSEIGWGNRAIEILAEHKKCVEDWKRKAAIPQKIEGKKRRTFDKNCSKLFLPSPLKWYNNAMVIATLENEAHGLFSDPPWMKVFKTTYDSLYDHLIKVNWFIAGSKYIKSLLQI